MHIFAYRIYIKYTMSHSVHLWDCDVHICIIDRDRKVTNQSDKTYQANL